MKKNLKIQGCEIIFFYHQKKNSRICWELSLHFRMKIAKFPHISSKAKYLDFVSFSVRLDTLLVFVLIISQSIHPQSSPISTYRYPLKFIIITVTRLHCIHTTNKIDKNKQTDTTAAISRAHLCEINRNPNLLHGQCTYNYTFSMLSYPTYSSSSLVYRT